jgi:hypothetical protein
MAVYGQPRMMSPGATFAFSIPRGFPGDMTGVHNLDALQMPAGKDAQRIVRNP